MLLHVENAMYWSTVLFNGKLTLSGLWQNTLLTLVLPSFYTASHNGHNYVYSTNILLGLCRDRRSHGNAVIELSVPRRVCPHVFINLITAWTCSATERYYWKYTYRLDVQGAATRWAVNDEPLCLSVNASHNLLVAFKHVHKIKEFSSHGNLLRELTLPGDVVTPWHTIQLTNGQFVVCHCHVVVT